MSETTINPNLILKSTETDLTDEYIDETFWDSLAVTDALETEYGQKVPDSVMVRKTKKIKYGAKYIEFGLSKELEGEGRYDDEVLSGHEEPMEDMDNRCYFSVVRHGVPYPLKELEAWYLQAFNQLEKKRKKLAIWNGKVAEQWAWQSFVYGCPDKVNAKHGDTASPQKLHPNWYVLEAAGAAAVTWDATEADYEDAVATALGDLAAADNISVDRIWEMEVAAADLHLRQIPVSVDGGSQSKAWLWVYPRAARVRIKNVLKDYFKDADVRGPNNRLFKSDVYKFGSFLFVESAYIPRVSNTGDTTVALEESWAYDSDTNTRTDERTSDDGIVHAILGADAECLAEPEGLRFDFERKDYKAKEGIGTYRMMGYKRNEVYDNSQSITEVLNQSSICVTEHNLTS